MITNGMTVHVKMTRRELCDLMMACTGIKFNFMDDLNKATDEDAKKIAEGGIRKWERLHDMLKEQLDAFDEIMASKGGLIWECGKSKTGTAR